MIISTPPPKPVTPGQPIYKAKIGLAGPKEKVVEARNLIKELTRYYHTPITHPGISHSEMDIDSRYYNYIIGSKGSEIKHIQNSYKVSVHIPNVDTVNQSLLIVGEPESVSSAEKYILKLIEKVDAAELKRAQEAEQRTLDMNNRKKALEEEKNSPKRTIPDEEPEEEWVKEFAPSEKISIDFNNFLPQSSKTTPAAPPNLPKPKSSESSISVGNATGNGIHSAWSGLNTAPEENW